MPSCSHNIAVVGSDRAVLSVIFGNQRFEIFEVASDRLYQLELLDAEQHFFWDCVIKGKEPVPATPRQLRGRSASEKFTLKGTTPGRQQPLVG